MYKILVDQKSLYKRGNSLNSLLRPIRSNNSPFAWKIVTGVNQIVIATREKNVTSDFRDWRINTFHSNLKANYFEVWRSEKNNLWCMEKCYLNFFYLNRSTQNESEYICIHADPLEINYTHLIYKQSIHIHISKAEDPIPHGHLAIGHQFLSSIYASEQTFFSHFKEYLQLIVHEILSKVP